MPDQAVSEFIEAALRVSLSDEERADLRGHISAFVKDIEADEPSNDLQFAAGAFGLSAEEKNELKSNFLSFMKENPVLQAEAVDAAPSHPHKPFGMFSMLLQLPLIACLVLLLTGTGVAYAAYVADPESPLYPIRLGIIEQASFMFSDSTEETARLHADLAVRRLREADALSKHEAVPHDTYDLVMENFEFHVQGMRAQMNTLAEAKSLDSMSRVETGFYTEVSVLSDALKSDTDPVRRILPVVELAVLESLQSKAGLDASLAATDDARSAAAETLRSATEARVSRMRTWLTDNAGTIDQPVRDRIEARLHDAEEVLIRAQAKLLTGSTVEGVNLLKTSLKATSEATVFMRSGGTVGQQTSTNVGVETAVSVPGTSDVTIQSSQTFTSSSAATATSSSVSVPASIETDPATLMEEVERLKSSLAPVTVPALP